MKRYLCGCPFVINPKGREINVKRNRHRSEGEHSNNYISTLARCASGEKH